MNNMSPDGDNGITERLICMDDDDSLDSAAALSITSQEHSVWVFREAMLLAWRAHPIRAIQLVVDSLRKATIDEREPPEITVSESNDFIQTELPPGQGVTLLVSPLNLTSRAEVFQRYPEGLRLFEILTGFYTTHWGLKIRQKCYDLKRSGANSTFEDSDEANRNAREVVDAVYVGRTHFNHNDIVQIGKHLIVHYEHYSLIFESCQPFALNVLAASLLCSSCYGSETPKGPTNAFYTLYSIGYLRRVYLEAIIYAGVIMFVVRPVFEPPLVAFVFVPLSSLWLTLLCEPALHGYGLRNPQPPGLNDYLAYHRLPSVQCNTCKRFGKRLERYRRTCASTQARRGTGTPDTSALKLEALFLNILLSFPLWEEPVTLACILQLVFEMGPLPIGVVFLAYSYANIALVRQTHGTVAKTGLAVNVMRRKSGISIIPLLLLASVVLMARGRREITWRSEIVQSYRRDWLIVLGPMRACMRYTVGRIFPQVYSNLPIPSIEQFSDWFLSWILVILGYFTFGMVLLQVWFARNVWNSTKRFSLLSTN